MVLSAEPEARRPSGSAASAHDPTRMAFEAGRLLAGFGVPEPYGAVIGARGEAAIRQHRQRPHPTRMAFEPGRLRARAASGLDTERIAGRGAKLPGRAQNSAQRSSTSIGREVVASVDACRVRRSRRSAAASGRSDLARRLVRTGRNLQRALAGCPWPPASPSASPDRAEAHRAPPAPPPRQMRGPVQEIIAARGFVRARFRINPVQGFQQALMQRGECILPALSCRKCRTVSWKRKVRRSRSSESRSDRLCSRRKRSSVSTSSKPPVSRQSRETTPSGCPRLRGTRRVRQSARARSRPSRSRLTSMVLATAFARSPRPGVEGG